MKNTPYSLYLLLFFLALLVSACSGQPAVVSTPSAKQSPIALQPSSTAALPLAQVTATIYLTPTPELSPAESLLAANQSKMNGLESVGMHILVDSMIGNTPISVTMQGGVILPDRSFFTVDEDGEISDVVMQGNKQAFSRVPGSEVWIEAAPASISPLTYQTQFHLSKIAIDPQLGAIEMLEGVETQAVTFEIDMAKYLEKDPTLANLFDPAQSRGMGTVWIGIEDKLTRKQTTSLSMDVLGRPVKVTIEMLLEDFNQPVDIPQTKPSIKQSTIMSGEPLLQTAFSPDSAHLAALGLDGEIFLWQVYDLATGPRTIVLPDSIAGVPAAQIPGFSHFTFSPDGQFIAAAAGEKVFLYTLADLSIEPTIISAANSQFAGPIDLASLGYSPDGGFLVAGDSNSNLFIWKTNALLLPPSIAQARPGGINDLVFSPDSQRLFTAGGDGSILHWSLADLNAPMDVMLSSANQGAVSTLGITADGVSLLSVGVDNPLLAWSMVNPQAEAEVLIPQQKVSIDKPPTITFALAPDGITLATTEEDEAIRLWPVVDPDAPFGILRAHQDDVLSLAYSPDGSYLASAGTDGRLILWQLKPSGD